MAKYSRFFLAGLALLLCFSVWNCQTGGSELPNEITGQLVAVNHQSTANVRVGLYSVNYIPADTNNRGLAWTTQTDAAGNYAFKNIPSGRYNLVGLRDSLGFFRDSVSVSGEAALGQDSLRLLGALSGTVQLQPEDDAQNAVVQVMGTDNYTNVASGGAFTLKGLADGTYRIRVSVALPNYVELFTDVRVRSGLQDTLPHPLIPFYSGIPMVENIRTTYDTARGIAKITWHPVTYPALLSYLIYRDVANSLDISTTPINRARLTDTVFYDTLYRSRRDTVVFNDSVGFIDTVPSYTTGAQDWEYRVRVQAKNGKTGETFQTGVVHAVPPPDLSTHIQFRRVGKNPDVYMISDTLFKGDTARFVVKYSNATLALRNLIWTNAHGVTLRSAALTGKSGSDTLLWVAPAAATGDTLTVRITDASGVTATGSLGVNVLSARIIGSIIGSIIAPTAQVYAYPWNGKIIHIGADSVGPIFIGLFDVATGRDSTLSSRAYRKPGYYGNFATAFWGSKVILFGAHSSDFNQSNVLTFDVASGAWAAGPNLTPNPLGTCAVASGSKVYVLFGDSLNPFAQHFSSLDLTTQTWSAAKSPDVFGEEGNFTAYNQELYRLSDENGPATSSLDAYDPALDAWTVIPVSKRLASTMGAQLATVNGRVYLFGGWSSDVGTGYQNTVESYDPTLKSWIVNAPFLVPRAYSGIVALGSKFYLVGGESNDGPIATVEEYEP